MSDPRPSRHRRCIVLRGSPEQTAGQARSLTVGLAEGAVLWIGDARDGGRHVAVPPRRVARALGGAFDAVVLDGHRGLFADVLGQCQGMVRGGGGLVLRLPERGSPPPAEAQRWLAAFPYGPEHVGRRFMDRLERVLQRAALDEAAPLRPAPRIQQGTDEQAQLVAWLAERLGRPTPPLRAALLADRGRGKSSALGLMLRELEARPDGPSPAGRVAVTAAQAASAAEIFRFARGDPAAPTEGTLRFVPLSELVLGSSRFEAIIVDEAAQLPVPLLQRLVQAHPAAHLIFATTTHGYEGTGRGFTLRFLEWWERHHGPVERRTLVQPIRWSEGDPLERLIRSCLMLDAEPAPLGSSPSERARATRAPAAASSIEVDAAEPVALDRDALLADEARLRELFGLLVHAHYRTTPSDLHRLLDAPNVGLHALLLGGHVVAATIVAREGGLPLERCEDILRGRIRVRAHALPDALVAHLGYRDAGTLPMLRSVRIAVHPALRRRGLATGLVEHVHRTHAPALFGTMFGATPPLLAFRRSLGYRLVRLSASRGARTGEPSALMLRPCTAAAAGLVDRLRAELARELPLQLELMQADDELRLEPAMLAALRHGLPAPARLSSEEVHAMVVAYATGPRTFESAAVAVTRYVEEHREELRALEPGERRVVEGRVLARHGWRRVRAEAAQPSVPATMRTLRRAIRRLVST